MNPVTGPSAHLTWEELACRDRMMTAYPGDWRPARAANLGQAFEDVRQECSVELGADCPLTVLEGYRTTQYQNHLLSIPKYKAAAHSQHCEGRAVDVACPRGLTFSQFVGCVRRAAMRSDSTIRYVELRPSMHYIHIDTRQTTILQIETVD